MGGCVSGGTAWFRGGPCVSLLVFGVPVGTGGKGGGRQRRAAQWETHLRGWAGGHAALRAHRCVGSFVTAASVRPCLCSPCCPIKLFFLSQFTRFCLYCVVILLFVCVCVFVYVLIVSIPAGAARGFSCRLGGTGAELRQLRYIFTFFVSKTVGASSHFKCLG